MKIKTKTNGDDAKHNNIECIYASFFFHLFFFIRILIQMIVFFVLVRLYLLLFASQSNVSGAHEMAMQFKMRTHTLSLYVFVFVKCRHLFALIALFFFG